MTNREKFSKPAESPTPRKGPGNVNDYTQNLKSVSKTQGIPMYREQELIQKQKLKMLAQDLTEPREQGLAKLKEMNLPQPQQFFVPAIEFLQNPEKYLKKLDSPKIYISLNPRKKDLPRYRVPWISTEEAIAFVRKNLVGVDPKEYDVLGFQFLENIYGGSIVINPDGKILVEFRHGQQGPVATGTETPEFSVRRDIFNLSFKYSFEDPELRQEIYKTILRIPHEGNGRDMKFTPGYYEFALVRKDEQSPLNPWFFDYKNDKAYHIV
jgi:hypothetical protein